MDSLTDIIKNRQDMKAPAYPWQDLALIVIKELMVPAYKRSAVFKICKDMSPQLIKQALNDTKELCQQGSKWRYFFKIVEQEKNKSANKKL